jgi:malate dehydrogenase (oxaloacetate-decarboxylating)(NADP+)
MGVIASEATRVTTEMFFVAARTLAALVTDADLSVRRVYPELRRIREVSTAIACEVAQIAIRRGLTQLTPAQDPAALVAACTYEPGYVDYV